MSGDVVEKEEREIVCDECNGDGGGEVMTGRYSIFDGSPQTRWSHCPNCDGSGRITVEMKMLQLEDLDND